MAEQPVHHQQHGSGLGGSQFGDTTLTKIFVGGLAWETQRDTMRAYFEQFGDILEAVVITDKNTGRSKGYGFVTFKDPESARRACENPTPVIDGRRANCNLAALGVRPRFPGFQGPRLRHFAPIIGTSSSSQQQQQQQPQQHQQQQQQVPFAYHQAAAAGFSYAPYGYTYVHEYPYPSLYNPYGNPQLSAAVYGGGGANSSGGGGGGAAGGGLTSPGSGGAGGSGGGALYTYSTAGFNPAAAAATYPMSSPSYAVPQLLQYPPSSGLASPYVPAMVPLQHQPSASSPQSQSQQQQQQSIASPSSSSSQQASNAPAGLTVVPSTNTTTTSTTMATTTTTTS